MFITFIFSLTRFITLEIIEIWSQTKDLSTLKQLSFGVRQWLVKGYCTVPHARFSHTHSLYLLDVTGVSFPSRGDDNFSRHYLVSPGRKNNLQ